MLVDLETLERGPRASKEPSSTAKDAHIYDVDIDIHAIDADAVKVLKRLREYGYEAYLVGGGVRDLLLGRKPKDFDIATDARPRDIRSTFRNCRIVGRRFRLGHVVFANNKIIEVATFRRDPRDDVWTDSEENGAASSAEDTSQHDILIRHDNAYGEPHEDARRRDFTINGLFYDVFERQVTDYVGGLRDLRAHVLRTIGDPDVRFQEDPVRMLRAIRFGAGLGFEMDPKVEAALGRHAPQLLRAAKARLFEEILRLLRSGSSEQAMYLCQRYGILNVIFPELDSWLKRGPERQEGWRALLCRLDAAVREGNLPPDELLVLLLHWGPALELIHKHRHPGHALYQSFAPLVEHLALPRRFREQMRQLGVAYKRSGSQFSAQEPSKPSGHRQRSRFSELRQQVRMLKHFVD
jgi:poly(A) polymerase